jgi:site-specific recombinase XerD
MTKNLTLFDTDTSTIEALLNRNFEDWIAHRQASKSRARHERPLLEESINVYREMWQAFAQFCAERNLTLPEVTITDLETFLTIRGSGPDAFRPRQTTRGPDLSARYANRYLVLINKVTSFIARRDGIEPNRAASTLRERPEYRYSEAADKDPPPEYLDEMQARVLIAYLTRAPQADAGEKFTWKTVRDRSAVALMLGAGLAPGDVRSLKLDGVIVAGGRKAGVPWKLSVEGNGNSPARETPLADWAGRQLAFWLRVRAEQGMPGNYVFPATMKGNQWSHSRCFESSRDVLEAAKLGKEAGGLFKLRHTFALRQLRKGKSEEDVARWLGFLDAGSMVRYRRIVLSYQDVV